ncbi:MAG TPA: ABC transporter permease, partial [Longimicrobiales bacterium]|nr:ABC transporter permease [Longimicrobiales bacterium]
FDRPEQIIHLERSNLQEGQRSLEVPIHDYVDWRAQQKSFQHLAAYYTATVNVSGTEQPERFEGAFLTANTFPLLGVQAVQGRLFREGEDSPGAEPVALISYTLWQTRFEGDRNIIGRVIRANGQPTTIVGVLPDQFQFPERQQLWLPLRLDALKLERGQGSTLEVVGRLRDGVSIDEAAVEFDAIARRLELEHPKTNQNIRPVLKPFTEEFIGEEPRALLFTMLGAVFFVLLIACTNVANLLLGRAILRSKEVGIRTALGAGRWRLVTQFLTEALVLSLVGALLGTVLAYIGIRLFNNAIASTEPPFWISIRLDGVALMFVLSLALVSSLFAGTIPALQASRSKVTDVLKDESRGASSFRLGRISRALVVFEIALSCGLLVAAGLTVKSVVKLRRFDFGFNADRLFTARLGLPELGYADTTQQLQFFEQVATRVSAISGVSNATLSASVPGLGFGRRVLGVEGIPYERDQDYPSAGFGLIGLNYFQTLGMDLLDGRDFNALDRTGALPVAIVNRSFAQKFFANQTAIGRRVRLGDSRSKQPWLTIVGVVPDATTGEIDDPAPEAMYVPLAQNPSRFMSIIARTNAEPMTITPAVRGAVTGVDPDIPLYFVRSLRDAVAQNTWFYRVFGGLFMIFGLAALLLAAIGLYAVMAFSVSQRTREVGIRMAIGAQAGDVLRMIIRQGLVQVILGTVIGLGLAAGVSQLMTIILFNVQPRDPAIFGAIILLLSTTALLACTIPARRATRVDPLEALRYE